MCLIYKNYLSSINLQVAQPDLHRHFPALGAGVIEEVRVQRDKGFGFVRFSTHAEAALAIQMGNTQSLFGKQMKVCWIMLTSFTIYLKPLC
jgi:nucleolysin TIA-1/TIAR